MDENKNAWELNAEWWQNSFTNGANAEYSQQLLPLVVELINEFEKVLEIGAGEGQINVSYTHLTLHKNREV